MTRSMKINAAMLRDLVELSNPVAGLSVHWIIALVRSPSHS
jgi:hypothetical protein